MKKNSTTVDILLLILITVIAYLPVSAFIFSLKNDSLVQYLPYRYHLSESIQHGYFPFWSPYLYTGFPIHADMQGMTWNPIVLLISLFTRYNMSVLEFEVTIYLVLAAIGMYSLLRSFSLDRMICILGGISYMSCGFINGSASVIPWISSAAFIPFVFKYLKRFLETPHWKTALSFSTCLSLLFLCGYPTFFIYTCYIIFAVVLFAVIKYARSKPSPVNLRTAGFLLLGVFIFLCICAPAIISYWEFLPYYSRGAGVTVAKAAQNPFTPFSSVSLVLPNAVHKDHPLLDTDPSMRNTYVGLFVFLLFCLSFSSRYNKWQKLVAGITIFSFVLSLGSLTPLHKLCYSMLPLFDTFRHPGNLRLFTSIGIILLAALYVQTLFQRDKNEIKKKFLQVCYILTGILGVVAVYCLLQPGTIKNISAAMSNIKEPKAFLDTFSFDSFLFFQSVVQVVFVAVLIYQLRKKEWSRKIIARLFALNAVIFCWIALPFTFISQVKTNTINQYVNSFPDGYPLPDINASVEAAVIADSVGISPYGYANFYSKTVTIQDHIISPTLNKDYESFLQDIRLRRLMANYPLAWLNDTICRTVPESVDAAKKFSVFTGDMAMPSGTAGTLVLEKFTPNSFTFRINTQHVAILSILQQYNHNWKARIHGNRAGVLKMNTAFMAVQVPAGENLVEFIYKPSKVITAMWLAVFTICILIVSFILPVIKKRMQ